MPSPPEEEGKLVSLPSSDPLVSGCGPQRSSSAVDVLLEADGSRFVYSTWDTCPETGHIIDPRDGKPLLLSSLGHPDAKLMPPVPEHIRCNEQVMIRGAHVHFYLAGQYPWMASASMPLDPGDGMCRSFSGNCRAMYRSPVPESLIDLQSVSSLPLEDEAYERLEAANRHHHHHHHHHGGGARRPSSSGGAGRRGGAGNMFSNQYWERQRVEFEREQREVRED